MPRRPFHPLALFVIVLATSPLLAWGAPDDFEVDARAKDAAGPNARANMIIDRLTMEQLENWVFQSAGQTRDGWIKQCEGSFRSRLAEIETGEPLNEQQRASLKLAMQGDIERVTVQFEKFLEKHPPSAEGVNNEQWNAVWQDIQPLRQEVSNGIFRKNSLFSKTFRQVASESQWNRLQELEKERRKKSWLVAVQLMVVQLDQACPMRHEQREALTKVLSERNPPIVRREDGNAMYICYAVLAKTPAEKWKTLFDDRQRPRIEKFVERYQGMNVQEAEEE